ncbi:MAG: DUF4893 domain-containing protein [Pseudomonadota bacterium]|nr:DUF4893 domain-containing protein [Pseudomonadota bacterium]
MKHLASALLLILAACATTQATPPMQGWQQAATELDRQRLRDWRTAFTRALEQARAAGHAADIQREGDLLSPDAALGGPIPNGEYRCRVIKVGAKSEGLLNYIAYPAFRCRISQQGKVQHFDKLNGSQRPHGTFYPADRLRSVFLGTMVLGDETVAYQYGTDPERDLAGWVERIGDNRWRIVFPYPHYESTLDVIELVPEQ